VDAVPVVAEIDAGEVVVLEQSDPRLGQSLLTANRPTAWLRMTQAVVYATALEPGPGESAPGSDGDFSFRRPGTGDGR